VRGLLLLLLAACGDAELDPIARDLASFEAGKAAYEAGDFATAEARFHALAASPLPSATPASWEVMAVAGAGDTARALSLAEAALKRFPEDVTLRYNRAALRARLGDLAGAAEDLRRLYEAQKVDPFVVGEDPDFIGLATHPDYAELAPRAVVAAAIGAAPPSVLLGEELRLVIEIIGPASAPLSITGPATTAFSLRRVVENELPAQGRLQGRQVELSLRALTPGDQVLGPWRIAAVDSFAEVGPVRIEVVALGDRSLRPGEPLGALPLPSALAAGQPVPGLLRAEGRGLLIAPVDAAVTAPEGLPMELRRQGQPALMLRHFPAGAEGRVLVEKGGQVLLDQPLAAP
jgi:hypothetical protein